MMSRGRWQRGTELASNLAKGPFDLVLRSAAFQPQDLIVVVLLEPIGNIPPAEAEANYYAGLEEPALAA